MQDDMESHWKPWKPLNTSFESLRVFPQELMTKIKPKGQGETEYTERFMMKKNMQH